MIRTPRLRPAARWRGARAVAAVAMLAGAMAAGAAVPASAATGWTVQTVPNPAGTTATYLEGVSCPSVSNCIAVGSTGPTDSTTLDLAEHWNGSTWALQTAASPAASTMPGLNAVSCPTATYCVAVGANDPTATTSGAIAESWNGSTWTLRPPVSPADAWLSAVSCTATTNCEAVGVDTAGTLAEHWNGSAWAAQTVPASVKGLTGVSCLSTSFCLAVNTGGQSTVWNGSTWSAAETAADVEAYSVACTSTTSCEAVGYSPGYGAAAERWNGSTWTYQSIPVSSEEDLFAVSCASAASCTATGQALSGGSEYPLAEYWNGSYWGVQTTTEPSGAFNASFEGVSCATATTDCTAVGDWDTDTVSYRSLAEQRTS